MLILDGVVLSFTRVFQWHPATDALSGTASYGDPTRFTATTSAHGGNGGLGDSRVALTFSVPFSHWDFDQYMFASGDFSAFMIMDKGPLVDCQDIKATAVDLPWNPGAPPEPQTNIPAWVFCVRRCADFEFRVTPQWSSTRTSRRPATL